MKINKTTISEDDLINRYLPADYSESLVFHFRCSQTVTADDIQIAFWTDPPLWLQTLFKLRDWLVKPLGLQSGGGDKSDKENFIECIRYGGKYRLFSVLCKSDYETVLCVNDKHLAAYFSVKVITLDDHHNKNAKITTLVKYHNKLGIAYFFIIFPFHHIIVKRMLKHTLKKLEIAKRQSKL